MNRIFSRGLKIYLIFQLYITAQIMSAITPSTLDTSIQLLTLLILSAVIGVSILGLSSKYINTPNSSSSIARVNTANLLRATDFLSAMGFILLVLFLTKNISSLDIIEIATFAELYRNGSFSGSGLYTGLTIYILPVWLGYIITVTNTSLSKILFPLALVLCTSLILGLRIILFPIMIGGILRLTTSQEVSKKGLLARIAPIICLVLGFIFLSILVKNFLGQVDDNAVSSIQGNNPLIDPIISILGRIKYGELLEAVNIKAQTDCLTPFSSYLFEQCADLGKLKYSMVSASSLRHMKGVFTGIAIPLPLLLFRSSSVFFVIFFSLLTVVMVVLYNCLYSSPFSITSVFAYCILYAIQIGLVEDALIPLYSLPFWILYLLPSTLLVSTTRLKRQLK